MHVPAYTHAHAKLVNTYTCTYANNGKHIGVYTNLESTDSLAHAVTHISETNTIYTHVHIHICTYILTCTCKHW